MVFRMKIMVTIRTYVISHFFLQTSRIQRRLLADSHQYIYTKKYVYNLQIVIFISSSHHTYKHTHSSGQAKPLYSPRAAAQYPVVSHRHHRALSILRRPTRRTTCASFGKATQRAYLFGFCDRKL